MRKTRCLALVGLLALLASCADFSLYGTMKGELSGGPLQISPVAVTLVVGATCTFSASGGSPPYLFSIATGAGSIDLNRGLYTAPAIPGNAVIQVQDGRGAFSQATATIVY